MWKKIVAYTVMMSVLTACTNPGIHTPQLTATDQPQAGMPNPASLFCQQQGHKLEIHTSADGSQSGICVFADGSSCDEWAYFRGECGPVEVGPTITANNGFKE